MDFHAKNILPATLALRATVAVRPSFSSSLPRKHPHIHTCYVMQELRHCFSLSIDILCPVAVALRGRVTDLSVDVDCCPLATPIVRPGKKLFKEKSINH